MAQRTLDSDGFARSTVSNGLRRQATNIQRDVLWNVIQPGDPYDIRRSMIAKLPSKSKNFMGDNTELVCLLQAAEIQRLNQYLLEYRERYIELERRELDRHSYEIQIKELTQRLAGEENLRIENHKLQEHIRRLNIQIEDLHQKLRASTGSAIDSENYQNALRKIQSLIQQNNTLTYNTSSLENEIKRLQSELQALQRSRSQERDEFNYRLNEASRVAASMNENQSVRAKLESELQRAERQIQRLSQSLEMKNFEIKDLVERLSHLEGQLNNEKGNYYKMAEYENRIALMAQQIERLSEGLKEKHKRYDDLVLEKNQWDTNFIKVQGQKRQTDENLKRAYLELDRLGNLLRGYESELSVSASNKNIMEDMQKQLLDAGNEIDRLNKIIKMLTGERDSVRRDYDQLIYQVNRLPILERENEDLKRQINGLLASQQNIREYEEKITILTTEITHLQQNGYLQDQLQRENQKLREENARLRVDINKIEDSLRETHITQIQNIRRQYEDRIRNIEVNTSNRYITEINETKNKYETIIGHLSQDVDPDAQKKIQLLVDEVDRLNKVLESLRRQNNQLIVRNGQLERIYPQLQEKDQIIRNLELRLQDLDARIRGLLGEKVDVETRIRSISQENENVKKTYDFTIRDLEALKQENEYLRRQLGDINDLQLRIRDLQKQLREMTAENDRLKELFVRVDELHVQIQKLKAENGRLRGQNYNLEMRLRQEFDGQIRSTRDEITNKYQVEITNIQNYYSQRISELERDADPDAQKKIQYLDEELDRLNGVLEKMKQQINVLSRQNIDLRNSIRENEDKNAIIAALQAKITSLQNQLREMQGENMQVHTRVRSISEQNQNFRRNQDSIIRELEFLRKENVNLKTRLSQLMGFEKKAKDYEGELNYLRIQVTKINDLITQLNSLKSENQRLVYELRNLQGQADMVASLTEQIRSLESKLIILEEENKKLTYLSAQLQTKQAMIFDLTKMVQDLQKRVSDLQSQNNRLKNDLKSSADKDNLIAHLTARIKELQKKIRELEGETSEHMNRTRSMSQQYDSLKRNHDMAGRDIDALRRENDELKRKITELIVELEKNKNMRAQIEHLEEQLRYYREESTRLASENSTLQDKIRELLNLENEYLAMKQTNGRLTIQITEISKKIHIVMSERDQANSELFTVKANEKKQQEVLEELTKELDRLNELLGRKISELSTVQGKLQETTVLYEEIRIKYTSVENTIRILTEENSNLKSRILELQKRLDDANEKIVLLNTDLDRLEASVGEKDNIIKSKEVRIQEKTNIIDSLRREISEALNAKSELEARVRELESMLKRSEMERDNNLRDIQIMRSQIEALEREIRELKGQLTEFYSLRSQNERLILLLKQKDGELDREKAHWGRRVDDLEKDKKNLNKKKKISDLNNEYSYLELIFMQEEAQRLKKEKDNLYNKDITELRAQVEKLLADNAALKSYTAQLNVEIEQKVKYYEEKIIIIIREKEDLERQLERVRQENGKKIQKNKLRDLIKAINENALNRNNFYQDELKRTKGQKKNITINYQIEIRKLMDELNSEKSKTISETQKIKEYESLVERLNQNLKDLYTELSKKDSDRKQLQNQVEDYKYKIHMLEKEDDLKTNKLRSLEEILDRLRRENTNYTHKISELQIIVQKITVYESKITELTRTIEVLNDRNTTLITEERDKGQKYKELVAELRDYETTLQNLLSQYRSLEKTLAQYREQNDGLHDSVRNMDKLKGDLSKAQFEKSTLNNNLDLLNETLARLRSEKDQVIKKNLDQENRISERFREEYSRRISEYERVISELNQKNSGLRDQVTEVERLKIEISQLTKKIERLTREIERINGDLKDSNDKSYKLESSNGDLKRTLEEYLRKITQLQKQKNELEAIIDRRGQQAEACIEKFTEENRQIRIKLERAREATNKIPEYEAKIQELNRLVDELTDKIHHDFKTQASFGNKISSIEQERNELLRTVEQLKQKLFISETSFKTSMENLAFENNDLKKKSSSIPELNIKTQSLQAKNYQLISEIQRLEKVIIEKDSDIERIRNSYESKLQASSAEMTKLVQNHGKLQSEYSALLREYELLKQKANESDIGISRINQEFQRLQSIIEKLRIERTSIIEKNVNLGREYDRLVSINRGLEDDIKQLRLQLSDKIALQKRLQEQLALMVVLFAEIESLRYRIDNSDKENAELRRSSMTPFRL